MTAIEISIDCVIFGFRDRQLNILLMHSTDASEKSVKILPGALLNSNENLSFSAEKTLKLITNLDDIFLEQIGAFGDLNSNPNIRVVSIGYYALVNIEHHRLQLSHTSETFEWYPINALPKLAADHLKIIDAAYQILKHKIRHEPIGFNLLPENFSISQLQYVYEAILGTELNKRNFRTKIYQMKLLIETGTKQKHVAHKPAMLYRFDKKVYKKLSEDGFYFKL